jgi:hypothetical protein
MGRHDGPEKQLVPGSVVGFRFKHPSLHGGQPRPSPINSQGPVSGSLIERQTARAIGHGFAGTPERASARRVSSLVLTALGVGAANSPRFAPAGLLVERLGARVMIDGGPGSEPDGRLDAWLVTDLRSELIALLRKLTRSRGLEPRSGDFDGAALSVRYQPVVHTNHPAGGYLIRSGSQTVAWAPEFWEFPEWAAGADLMFAEAAGWSRPIRFAGGVGGHMDAIAVASAAQAHRVRRLVFAHIGRPTLRAIDRGERPPFGEFGRDGQVFRLPVR